MLCIRDSSKMIIAVEDMCVYPDKNNESGVVGQQAPSSLFTAIYRNELKNCTHLVLRCVVCILVDGTTEPPKVVAITIKLSSFFSSSPSECG